MGQAGIRLPQVFHLAHESESVRRAEASCSHPSLREAVIQEVQAERPHLGGAVDGYAPVADTSNAGLEPEAVSGAGRQRDRMASGTVS